MVVVLAGGMGAARFVRGLVRVMPPDEVTVIGNTGDDIEIYGVHVSPDLDIVTFMLAGVLDEERQFGLIGDTHQVMDELAAHGHDTWFSLGDRDFAICAARTAWLRAGAPMHECAARIAERFGVTTGILPMTDDPVYTAIEIDEGEIHFQEYWVRRRAADPARSVRLVGAAEARPAPGVLEAIASAEAVVVAPSNPVVSIGTILAVPGIREALRETRAPVVGVSPIIGGRVVRGMADKLLPALGADVSAVGVARLYADLLDAFVLDIEDEGLLDEIAGLGVRARATTTLMRDADAAAALAKETLALARE